MIRTDIRSAARTRSRRVRTLAGGFALALVAFAILPGAALAQFRTPTDTLRVMGSSSYEEGYLSFLGLNRAALGPRSLAMGGTGIAGTGSVEGFALNPANLVDVTRWELESEFAMTTGSGNVSSFPSRLEVGSGQFLETSNYRVSPGLRSGYRHLSLGMPLVLFGRRGGLALSYRRISPNFQGDETRFEVNGPITNNLDATTGVDQSPEGGNDAITVGIARNMSDFLDLGANLNFQSGTVKRNLNIGASVFGQLLTGGGSNFEQDLQGFNIDLGGRVHAGDLTLGGTILLGHNLTFKHTTATLFPLPDIQNPSASVLMISSDIPEHTLQVPAAFGLGGSYRFGERVTLDVDLWQRPWSKAKIERQALDPVFFFADPTDSSTFVFLGNQAVPGKETVNAGLENSPSLRVGFEYVARRGQSMELPLRLGFRSEKLAVSNVEIRPEYADYPQLVEDYWRYVVVGETPPEGVDPAELEARLANVLEHKDVLFRGTSPRATIITFGLGLHFDNFRIDLGAERASYDIDRYFFQAFDPYMNPFVSATKESRTATTYTFATRMTF